MAASGSGARQFDREPRHRHSVQQRGAWRIADVGTVNSIIDFDDGIGVAILGGVDQIFERFGLVEILA